MRPSRRPDVPPPASPHLLPPAVPDAAAVIGATIRRALAVAGLACAVAAVPSSAARAQVPGDISAEGQALKLGLGYNSVSGTVLQQCVEPVPGTEIRPAAQAAKTLLNMLDAENRTTLSRAMSLSAQASLGLGTFSGSAKYTNTSADTHSAYDRTFAATEVIVYEPEGAAQWRLTKTGKRALKQGPATFAGTCGDAYVSGVTRGGELAIVYTLADDDLTQETRTTAELKAKIGLWASGQADFAQTARLVAQHTLRQYRFYRNGALETIPTAGQLDSAVRAFPTRLAVYDSVGIVRAFVQDYGPLGNHDAQAEALRAGQRAHLTRLGLLLDSAATARDNFAFVAQFPAQFINVDRAAMNAGNAQAGQMITLLKAAAVQCAGDPTQCTATPCAAGLTCNAVDGQPSYGPLPERLRSPGITREVCLSTYDPPAGSAGGVSRHDRWISMRSTAGGLQVYGRDQGSAPNAEAPLALNEIPATWDNGSQRWGFAPSYDTRSQTVVFTKTGRYEGINGEAHVGKLDSQGLPAFSSHTCGNGASREFAVQADGLGGWEFHLLR